MGILFSTLGQSNLFFIDQLMQSIDVHNMRGEKMTGNFMEMSVMFQGPEVSCSILYACRGPGYCVFEIQ